MWCGPYLIQDHILTFLKRLVAVGLKPQLCNIIILLDEYVRKDVTLNLTVF